MKCPDSTSLHSSVLSDVSYSHQRWWIRRPPPTPLLKKNLLPFCTLVQRVVVVVVKVLKRTWSDLDHRTLLSDCGHTVTNKMTNKLGNTMRNTVANMKNILTKILTNIMTNIMTNASDLVLPQLALRLWSGHPGQQHQGGTERGSLRG